MEVPVTARIVRVAMQGIGSCAPGGSHFSEHARCSYVCCVDACVTRPPADTVSCLLPCLPSSPPPSGTGS